MKKNNIAKIFLVISIIGIILPYYQIFKIFMLTNTFDFVIFAQTFFKTNEYVTFIAFDFLITTLSIITLNIYLYSKSKDMQYLIAFFGLFIVGASFALPYTLYVYFKTLEAKNEY